MNSKIILEAQVQEVIHTHALEDFPNECCGFLYGKESEERTITLAQRVENTKEGDQRRRFEISPLEYIKAERFAVENGIDLLGVYHSHPNHPAIASVHDLEKAMPFFSYVIVSVIDGQLAETKSWKLKDHLQEFVEEEVLLLQRNNS